MMSIRLFRCLHAVAAVVVTVLGASVCAQEKRVVPESTRLDIDLRPLLNSSGDVRSVHVHERLALGSSSAFVLRAAVQAVLTKGVADRIHDLRAHDGLGSITFTASDTDPADKSETARLWHADRDVKYPIDVDYEADVQPLHENPGPPLGLKATGKGVSGAGSGFLAVPANVPKGTISLHWDLSGMPIGSVGVMTHGKGDVSIQGTPEVLLDQWYLAGPAERLEDTQAHFSAYGLGVAPYDTNAMFGWTDKAYRYLTQEFRYLDPPPNYVLLQRSLSFPGYATGTTFEASALIHTGSEFKAPQNLELMHNIIFHELTHLWVGEMDKYRPWFVEGLTVYSTAALMYRGNLSSTDEYLREINRISAEYYTSSARDWSEEKIEASGMSDEQVRRVPYDRGALYFANLDFEIRQRSHGKRGVYDMLASIFQSRLRGKVFDEQEWESTLAAELGKDAVEKFRNEVLLGTELVVPSSEAFGACFERSETTKDPNHSASTTQLVYQWKLRSSEEATSCAADVH